MMRLEQQRQEHETKLVEMEMEVHKTSQQIQTDSLEIARNLALSTEAMARNTAAAERIAEQSLGVATDSQDYNRRWTRVFVVFAILSFLVAILALSFPNGIDWSLTLQTWWEWMPWT